MISLIKLIYSMQKNKNFEQIPSNVISKNKCCPGLPYIFIPENTI